MGVSGTVLITGSTPAVNGTTGRVFYQNGSSLGQMTTTGSGTVLVLQTAPTLTGPVILNEAVGSSGLTLTGATQTSSFPVLAVTQTWNNGATVFTAASLSVTNTASADGSMLFNLLQGGSSRVSLRGLGSGGNIQGRVTVGPSASGIWETGGSDLILSRAGGQSALVNALGIGFYSDRAIRWANVADSGGQLESQTFDAFLRRDAAGTLAIRNGTNAQAFNLYNTFTSTTSYERLDLDWITTANVILIGAQKGSGGGTARVMSLVYGGTSTAAVSVPITSGQVTFGGGIVTGGTTTQGANFEEFTEMTAPAAGAANTCRIYAQDNGAGKTQLMALFNSGAAQQIAIQP